MGKLLVLAGPSAVGKSFTARLLVEAFSDDIAYAPVHTTRPRRATESRADERIFVSNAEFQGMIEDEAFFAYEAFAGFLYGYDKQHLQPKNKHLVIDISPYVLPDLVGHDSLVTLGLQAPEDFEELSERRMIERGDSEAIRAARRPFIRRDIEDLDRLSPLIEAHGKLFQIRDNTTIPTTVVPWIVDVLGIRAG